MEPGMGLLFHSKIDEESFQDFGLQLFEFEQTLV